MGINPVDSSIPLAGVNPVTTLKDLATVDNLRSEIDQRQQQSSRIPLQNQQTQLANDNAQLVNDQMKLDMSDAQKVKEFLSDPTNARAVGAGQFDTLYKLGVQPKIVQGLQKYSLESRETQAKLEHSDLENSQTRNSAVGKFLTSLNDEKDPARRQQAWQTGLSNLRANGLLKGVDLPQQFNGSQDEVNNLLVEHGFLSGVTDSALKRKKEAAETAQNEAKATSELATAAENTLKSKQMARQQVASQLASVAETNPAGLAAAVAALPPEHQGLFSGVTNPKAIRRLAMTPEQAVQADREEADLERRRMSDAETQRYHTGELGARQQQLGLEGARVGIERQKLAIEQQRLGFETGGGVSPQAKAIAAGELDPKTARAMLRSSPGLLGQIKTVDPGFDEANMERRYDTLKEFNSTSNSKAGGQAIALNTMIHHGELLAQAGEALRNGSFKPGNSVYNTISTMMGSAAPNNYNLVAQFLAGEVGKVSTGGVPGEHEIKRVLDTLGSNSSPQQMEQAGKMIIQIGAGKLQPLNDRVKEAKLDNVVHLIGQDTKDILQKRGLNPDTMRPEGGAVKWKAPDGQLLTFPSQSQLDKFKKDHGVQ